MGLRDALDTGFFCGCLFRVLPKRGLGWKITKAGESDGDGIDVMKSD
jgi:hypothetical protein